MWSMRTTTPKPRKPGAFFIFKLIWKFEISLYFCGSHFLTLKHLTMKQYSILFAAFVFAGTFADIDGAIDGFVKGSGSTTGANLTETTNEAGSTLTFTDADGNSQTAVPGDALKAEINADGSLKGYSLVLAADMVTQGWSETGNTPVAPTAPAAAATASADTANA